MNLMSSHKQGFSRSSKSFLNYSKIRIIGDPVKFPRSCTFLLEIQWLLNGVYKEAQGKCGITC